MKCSAFKRLARFGRDPLVLLIVVLAGLGTAHILVRTAAEGIPGIRGDSGNFLAMVRSFLAGEIWRDLMGTPQVAWPPLFPLLMAAGGWVGIEPLAAGRWINATAFGLPILVVGFYLRSHLRYQGLALASTATLAASQPLSNSASALMTDSLFVLLTLLALMLLAAFLHRGGRMPLWWAAVCTALAAVTRYVGVVLIGVGVLLLLVRRTPPLAVRLKDAIVFGAVSSLPLAGVLTYNWTAAGTLTGPGRSGSGQSLSDRVARMADIFREWVMLPNALDGFGYLLWTGAYLVVAGWSSWCLLAAWPRQGRTEKESRPASPFFGLEPAVPFGVFALAYLVFMILIVPLVVPVPIPRRYLLPVYVPLLLVATLLLDRFLCIKAVGRMAVAKWGLASLVLTGALTHVSLSASGDRNLSIIAHRIMEPGPTDLYNNAYWQRSETRNYVRTHLSDSWIFTNYPALIWSWTRSTHPIRHRYIANEIYQVTRRIMRKTKKGVGGPIVWLLHERPHFHSAYDALDLRCLPGVDTVAELADGAVFRVTATEPFDAKRHHACKQRYLKQLIQQAGEPVVRADWDVYRTGRRLIYVKQPCAPADPQAKFVLHVTPADPANLPADRKRYGSDNFDFYFDRRGVRVGDQCLATTHLPGYAIDRIYLGQWISKENRTLWEAEFAGAAPRRGNAQRTTQ